MTDKRQRGDADVTGLSEPALALYERLLRRRRALPVPDQLDAVAQELIANGFAVAIPGPPRQLVPITADVAVGRVMANDIRHWAQAAPDLDRYETKMRDLAELGHPLLEPRPSAGPEMAYFETFNDVAEAALFHESMIASARSRIDIMQPYPTWRDEAFVQDPATTTYMPDDHVGQGVAHRYLYDSEILAVDWFYKAALDEVDGGAQARVAANGLPTAMMIIDRSAALVACHPQHPVSLYTTAPLLISVLEHVFDSYWQQAATLQRHGDHTNTDDPAERVLDLVILGQKNAAIARQLGMSPRTVSRHLHRLYTRYHVPDRTALRTLLANATNTHPNP